MLRSQVYFNLHKRCFSVQQKGRVIGHADGIMLENVRFNIAKAGQRKVRETGRKNVHARVSGFMVPNKTPIDGTHYTMKFNVLDLLADGFRWAKYNPYKNDTFVDVDSGEELHDAKVVIMFTCKGCSPDILYKRVLS
ncbi:MAG: hypothetical protein CL532_00590 [Aestuariivita sp.]|nr:hypothetical protein [Aestuariivita sp.]